MNKSSKSREKRDVTRGEVWIAKYQKRFEVRKLCLETVPRYSKYALRQQSKNGSISPPKHHNDYPITPEFHHELTLHIEQPSM